MKRAGRAVLLGATITIAVACVSAAQEAISLVGLSASRAEDTAIIRLHTTAPAGFRVNRFTMGDWVTVWSSDFTLTEGVEEIPLDMNRQDLADLVTGASLVAESHRAGVRLYLGPRAHRAGVFVVPNGNAASVFVPAREDAADDVAESILENPPEPPVEGSVSPPQVGPIAAEGTPLDPKGATEVASTEDADPIEGPAAVAPVVLEPYAPEPQPTPEYTAPSDTDPVETTPALPDEPAAAEEPAREPRADIGPSDSPDRQLGAEEQLTEPAGSGSFYIPRKDTASPPTATKEPGAEDPAGAPSLPNYETAISRTGGTDLDSLLGSAEVNQMIRLDNGAESGPAEEPETGAGEPATLEELMQQATDTATQMLEQMSPEGGTVTVHPPVDFTTPYTPPQGGYDSPAEVSFRAETPPKPVRVGKDALSDIRIELFEILGTPLDQAFTLLLAPTDYNVIVDSSVGENVVSLSFKESQTDLKSALDLLTRTYGLEYVLEANTIVVAAKEKMHGHLIDYETRLFVLSYADPASIKEMLLTTGMLEENQVEIYEGEKAYLDVNDSTYLSTEAEGESTEIKPIQTNLSSTPRNAVLVKAVPEQMSVIAELVERIDRKPMLIDIEVRVCEANETALQDLGIELNNNTATPLPTETAWTEQPNENNVIEAFTAGSFYRSPLQFLATLNTQVQDGNVEVLAQPNLSTVEGKQAIYFAGERIPYISKVTITQGGQTQLEVDFLNVGVTLNFKPRLDADGKLTIDVNPIVSSLLEFRIIGELMEAPRTRSRQLATTVRVADNEPFVLAGLINEEERRTITKIPLLGDLPLVGKLFRNKNVDNQRTEIIIVVTPHIHE